MDNETDDELKSLLDMGDVSEENIIRPSVPQTRVQFDISPDIDSDNDSVGPALISQDSNDSADEELDPIADADDNINSVADNINAMMDPDVEAPEITKILKHQYNGGILEFLCKYDSGNTEWHPLELVKADDPWSVANYVMQNDLGDHANQIHRR